MSTYTLTPHAYDDLLRIWDYIADTDAPSTANRVTGRLNAECNKLGTMPGIGHYRLDLLDDEFRFWRVWKYLIVYRWVARPIEVVAVVHGSRDLGPFLADRLS